MPEVRKGQAPAELTRDEFGLRFRDNFADPAFAAEKDALVRIEKIAWQAYHEGRKAPVTRKAGPGYADPDYDLSVDWLATKEKIDKAQAAWSDPKTPSRVRRATTARARARSRRPSACAAGPARRSSKAACRSTFST
jgi:hypothetical protein